MNIVAIIPARKGSKSIKDKNIANYNKKPLLYYSINTALKIKLIDKVIVSTDSKKYKLLAEKYGAKVPFLRPKKYSGDKSLDREFLIHAYNFLKKKENYNVDLFVLLRPTTPNRKLSVVKKGINFFLKNLRTSTSMRSVSLFSQPPQKFFNIKRKYLKGLFDKTLKGEYHSWPRQNYKKTYLPNGYIDILKPSFFANKKKELFGKKILAFVTPETNDIDVKIDLLK